MIHNTLTSLYLSFVTSVDTDRWNEQEPRIKPHVRAWMKRWHLSSIVFSELHDQHQALHTVRLETCSAIVSACWTVESKRHLARMCVSMRHSCQPSFERNQAPSHPLCCRILALDPGSDSSHPQHDFAHGVESAHSWLGATTVKRGRSVLTMSRCNVYVRHVPKRLQPFHFGHRLTKSQLDTFRVWRDIGP